MGELKVKVGDKTEMMFREAAMHEFGFQKGSLSLAANKALEEWSKKHRSLDKLREIAKGKIKDPVRSIEGILKHVKASSVELQHEAGKIRAQRWKEHVSD